MLWDSFPCYAFFNGVRYEARGDRMRKQVGATNLAWGLPKCPAQPTLGQTGSGGNVAAGDYQIFCVGITADGSRTMPYSNTPQEITISTDNSVINVTNIPVFSDPQIVHVAMYRTPVDSLNPFQFAGWVRNGTTSLNLNGGDDSLPAEDVLEPPECLAHDETAYAGPFRYEKPPAKKRCFAFDGRLWVFGEANLEPGFISATTDSTIMTVSGGTIRPEMAGKSIVLEDESYGYRISKVLSGTQVETDQPYSKPNFRTSDPSAVPFRITGEANSLRYSETDYPDYFPWCNELKVGQETGGSLKAGTEYLGQAILFTEDAVYSVFPTGDAVLPYGKRKTSSPAGCPAPDSVVNAGSGVYFFDGEHFRVFANNSSVRIDLEMGDLAREWDTQYLPYIKGTRRGDRIYWAVGQSPRSHYFDRVVVYDMVTQVWDTPWTDVRLVDLATIIQEDGQEKLWMEAVAGAGYALAAFDKDIEADGLSSMLSGAVTSAGSASLYVSGITMPTAGIGLQGVPVWILEGTGQGQRRYIVSNTAHSMTLDRPWTTVPDTTSRVGIGAIDYELDSGRYGFGRPHDEKTFQHLEFGFKGESDGV